MIRILIADDHALIRSGLAQMIATASDMQVAAEAASGTEILELVQHQPFDLLLLDMNMPAPAGVELIGLLREMKPALPVLVLSMHNEGQIVRRALAAGAAGYVSKSSDPRLLLGAIRKIAEGGRFIDPALVDVTIFDAPFHGPPPQEVLTERELQILKMIGAGQPIGEIALQLHLSPKTVSTHKMRLMKKLQIDNNADLILFAFHHQLVAVPPSARIPCC
jgi:DNA-binding NarL/FixJ family response regulator